MCGPVHRRRWATAPGQFGYWRTGCIRLDVRRGRLDPLAVNLFQINLFVEDFDRMLRFYRDQLGFEVNDIDPGPPSKPFVNWASLRTGAVTLELFDAHAFGRQPAAGEGGRGAIELAFIVDDVERSRQRLEEADVSCGPVVEERWGRFAGFRDPERNQRQIFQVFGPGGDS